ncbi:hypothetical protein ScPMuIL_000235 [Solemya velum]
MYDRPVSLQECCVDFICDNLAALCEVTQTETGQTKHIFKDRDVCFHGHLSEQLLETLCEKKKLNDETLSLFDANATRLKKVSIKDAQLTTKGLRVLRPHKISHLEVTGLKSVTVNDVIGCLGEWTLSNLQALNVCNSTFLNSSKFCVVVSLSKLHMLQDLNVSNTEFNKHGLEIIAEDLPCLENLDISGTPVNDIAPLRKCKERLKSLCMYNLRAANTEEIVPILCELTKLIHLDISDDSPTSQHFVNYYPCRFKIVNLISKQKCLPCLKSLDISGKENVPETLLREFMRSHSMHFLGLALTDACEYSMFNDQSPDYESDIVVTGEATEKQIVAALNRYISRPMYVQKSLYTLFNLTQCMGTPREDIVNLVLPAMKHHPKQLGVQMAATACLYNLSKGDIGQKVHPSCLKEVVNLTLLAMENFPNHQQLQKNALLTLCSDRILQDVAFDRYRCAKLVMECLCSFDDSSMNRMSVAICSILAAKISTEQTSILGAKTRYMQKMLKVVKQKMEERVVDITLKFTLSALWNLTDESPPTCHVFLKDNGLELFMNALQVVSEMESESRVQVETKILGLLNNIAEVKSLRQALMREDFLMVVRRLLKAEEIDVSYFAAGIIAHLASDGAEAWLIAGTDRADILHELRDVVLNWKQPKGEMVAYRSFNPFFPLLKCSTCSSVQLWAVWAIQHVCTKNGKRYGPMLEDEGGDKLLKRIYSEEGMEEDVRQIASKVLALLEENKQAI